MFAIFGVTVFRIRLDKPKKTHTDAHLNFLQSLIFRYRASPLRVLIALSMFRSPPSLQQICLRSVVNYQEIDEILNPFNWDSEFDMSQVINDRLTYEEKRHYLNLAVTGQMTLTECKEDLRSLLYRRPFDRDLLLLRGLPLFDGLSDFSMRQIWAESIIFKWEMHLPAHLGGLRAWDELVMTWDILNSLLDGCTNSRLLEFLDEEKLLLIKKEKNELWRVTIGCVWLLEMISIDN